MSTLIEQYDYELPPELIAQEPMEPRDQSRLLVLSRSSDKIKHQRFHQLGEFLRDDDVLVFNDTKVFKARLRGLLPVGSDVRKDVTSKDNALTGVIPVEVFLLRAHDTVWEAMVRPGRKVNVGDEISFCTEPPPSPLLRKEGGTTARVCEKLASGIVRIDFSVSVDEVLRFCNKHGEVPVPPYVKQIPDKLDTYQTVYARTTGSVAAPTAGFHFTERLLDELRVRRIQMEYVTLHVGIGTFQPVKSETLEEHEMHSEFVQIDQDTAERINQAKADGRRIVAVGTTTTRALEGVASVGSDVRKDVKSNGNTLTGVTPYTGDISLFVTPGYEFKIVDALITNFHLPKSTLLALVSALATRDQIMAAYEEAKREGYRFYSFGDAMFIV